MQISVVSIFKSNLANNHIFKKCTPLVNVHPCNKALLFYYVSILISLNDEKTNKQKPNKKERHFVNRIDFLKRKKNKHFLQISLLMFAELDFQTTVLDSITAPIQRHEIFLFPEHVMV